MDENWLLFVIFCCFLCFVALWCGVGGLDFWDGLLCGIGVWWIIFFVELL